MIEKRVVKKNPISQAIPLAMRQLQLSLDLFVKSIGVTITLTWSFATKPSNTGLHKRDE